MERIKNLQKLISSIDVKQSTKTKEKSLQEITVQWDALASEDIRVTQALSGNKLLSVFASVMKEKQSDWKNPPSWPDDFLYCIRQEREFESELYPLDQVQEVVKVFKGYLQHGNFTCLRFTHHLAPFASFKTLLLQDQEIYDLLVSELDDKRLGFCQSMTINFEWKLKFISDRKFMANVLALPPSNIKWLFLISVSHHPDAKTLLPTKEIIAAVLKSNFPRSLELCALLCNEDDLKELKLSTEWLNLMQDILQNLIKQGKYIFHNIEINILAPVIPIVNLSNLDLQKDMLGLYFVALLKRVVTEDLPNTNSIRFHLVRARQEAAKALWNFGYTEANRALISQEKGIEKLTATLATTNDDVLKQNITGILHMFKPASVAPVAPKRDETTRGHVMLSYNWGNQPIVKRIAKSLQNQGYKVWLDIEQMEGSTLEAMAHAVERSELVLICMSQKYKDSPNCRLEGEYCVNRKVNYIPLMMQKGYRPDGWLGIALGSKLYYEFTDEDNWENKIAELTKAIGQNGKVDAPNKPVAAPTAPAPPPKERKWTDEDLRLWMESEGIEQHYELFKDHAFGKRELLELQQPHYLNNPSFFFSMWERVGITEYGKILAISSAIRNLK